MILSPCSTPNSHLSSSMHRSKSSFHSGTVPVFCRCKWTTKLLVFSECCPCIAGCSRMFQCRIFVTHCHDISALLSFLIARVKFEPESSSSHEPSSSQDPSFHFSIFFFFLFLMVVIFVYIMRLDCRIPGPLNIQVKPLLVQPSSHAVTRGN